MVHATGAATPRAEMQPGSSEVLLSLDRDRDAIADMRYQSKQKGYELYIPRLGRAFGQPHFEPADRFARIDALAAVGEKDALFLECSNFGPGLRVRGGAGGIEPVRGRDRLDQAGHWNISQTNTGLRRFGPQPRTGASHQR
jgi:hypothetical protein